MLLPSNVANSSSVLWTYNSISISTFESDFFFVRALFFLPHILLFKEIACESLWVVQEAESHCLRQSMRISPLILNWSTLQLLSYIPPFPSLQSLRHSASKKQHFPGRERKMMGEIGRKGWEKQRREDCCLIKKPLGRLLGRLRNERAKMDDKAVGSPVEYLFQGEFFLKHFCTHQTVSCWNCGTCVYVCVCFKLYRGLKNRAQVKVWVSQSIVSYELSLPIYFLSSFFPPDSTADNWMNKGEGIFHNPSLYRIQKEFREEVVAYKCCPVSSIK